MARLQRTADHGPPTNAEQCHKLHGDNADDALFELKTHKLRLLWFYDKDKVIICTNGLLKGTRKAQDGAIAVGLKWKADYIEAKVHGRIQIINSHENPRTDPN